MEKRKHHYIPQFYLKYFTDPYTPAKQNPYVWIFDKKSETIYKKAPNNIAYKRGYNDITDANGNISNIVEDQFNIDIEANASRVLRKIAGIQYLTRTERLDFGKFVFSMIFRTPKFKDTFRQIVEDGYLKEFPDGESYYKTISPILSMDSVIRVTNVVSELLLKMTWSILIASDKERFITSDNPVIIFDPNDRNWLFTPFASRPNVQIFFPLTPELCLFGCWGRIRRVVEKIYDREVKEINLEIYKYSDELLFSSSRYFPKGILLVNHYVNTKSIK